MNRSSAIGTMRRAVYLSTAILCTAGLHGCDVSRPAELEPPEPGQLTLQFNASAEAEGAVRISLHGPNIGLITAAQEGALLLSRADGTRHNVIVLGTLISGPLLRFEVPDRNRMDEYGASLEEVSDVENLLRDDLSEYSLEIMR